MPNLVVRVPRLLAPTALILTLLAVPVGASASFLDADAASDPGVAAVVREPTGDDAADMAAEASADAAAAPEAEAPSDDEASGLPGAEDCRSASLRGADAEEPEEPEEPASDADVESCADDDAPDTEQSTATLRRAERIDGGFVTVTGPGRIDQVLMLKSSAAKAKRDRIVLGKARRRVGKAGRVHMTVTLTPAGRAWLGNADAALRATLTTKVKSRGTKARTTVRRITLKPV